MPTKVQAKAAVDAAAAAIKADIDNILPVGVNITDGAIGFAPTTWSIKMSAGGVSATANAWLSTIVANLTGAGRSSTVQRGGRRVDDIRQNTITIQTTLATYRIVDA